MSEQELYMMGDERAKDEIGAQNFMKKHQALDNAVDDFAGIVRQLGERSRNLIETEHPERLVVLWEKSANKNVSAFYFVFNFILWMDSMFTYPLDLVVKET